VDSGREGCKPKSAGPRRNYPWALLMRRVFACDVLACDGCGGRMQIVAAIQASDAIRRILAGLALPSRPPPIPGPDSEMEEPCIS